jgi:choline dehydrogenase-like flavoprotein
MFHSLENYADESIFKYDICIIGSGVAAHAFLSKFLSANLRFPPKIAVLEGSTNSQGKIHRLESNIVDTLQEQDLYQGEINGWIHKNDPGYLVESRQRSFGGTTNIWSGWCWPLEPEDLKERALRPGFSWPISYEELEFYYHQAQEFCRLGPYEYENPQYWIEKIKHMGFQSIFTEDSPFRTRMLHFNPGSLNEYYYDSLRESSTIDIYSNAHCLSLNQKINSDGCHETTTAVVRTLENKQPAKTAYFQADHFILAAGAIETTRLLLLSEIDKINSQIGKNFIEHPYLWTAAKFKLGNIPEKVKNFYFPTRPISITNRMGILPTLVSRQEFIESKEIGAFRILLGGAPHIPGTLNISWEQMPNLDSTISLSDTFSPDIFGQKRVKLDHKPSKTDEKTVQIIIKEGQDWLEKWGYGFDFEIPNLEDNPWKWEYPCHIVPGNHPMGTTRMSETPDQGVVDGNCRLHNFNNLYIASSSTFPTGGYANSTFTILALALRLGDYIKKENYS